ncbi:MAG: RDD family protein [Theionarchaea archaeon]|nr:RDD family protein [Theionarchaea archaeon]
MEDFTLQTAENVPVHYDIATAGSRCAAVLVDYGIILLILLGLGSLTYLFERMGDVLSSYFIALFYLLVGTLSWAYFVINEMLFDGRSVGKRMLGLRVIKEDGSPIDLVDSLTRNFIRFADLLPGTYLVGFVTMMFNERFKRLGDFAAGTLVVRTRPVFLDSLELEETPYDDVVQNSPYLSQITPEEYQLLRDYLTQRYRLLPYRSYVIAETLAARMAEKLQIEPPKGVGMCLQFIQSCVKYYKK